MLPIKAAEPLLTTFATSLPIDSTFETTPDAASLSLLTFSSTSCDLSSVSLSLIGWRPNNLNVLFFKKSPVSKAKSVTLFPTISRTPSFSFIASLILLSVSSLFNFWLLAPPKYFFVFLNNRFLFKCLVLFILIL